MVCEGGRRGRGERDGDDKKTRSVTVKWEERWLAGRVPRVETGEMAGEVSLLDLLRNLRVESAWSFSFNDETKVKWNPAC